MDILAKIVAHKRDEVASRRRVCPLAEPRGATSPAPRDFAGALRRPGVSVIAEIKRRSPSKGELCAGLDVAALARGYEQRGAAALSVLTDGEFFGGSDEDLQRARGSTGLPVLRKDFTIDEYQIHEARRLGADALLLIVRILSDAQLRDYTRLAAELGLAALVEVHEQDELSRAIAGGAEIIGVNSRNLDTFEVSLDTPIDLKDAIPAGCLAVAESGVRTRDDVRRLEDAGYDAILVGETLVSSPDPGAKLAELLGAA